MNQMTMLSFHRASNETDRKGIKYQTTPVDWKRLAIIFLAIAVIAVVGLGISIPFAVRTSNSTGQENTMTTEETTTPMTTTAEATTTMTTTAEATTTMTTTAEATTTMTTTAEATTTIVTTQLSTTDVTNVEETTTSIVTTELSTTTEAGCKDTNGHLFIPFGTQYGDTVGSFIMISSSHTKFPAAATAMMFGSNPGIERIRIVCTILV